MKHLSRQFSTFLCLCLLQYKISGCNEIPPYVGTDLYIKKMKFTDSGFYECVVSRMDQSINASIKDQLQRMYRIFVVDKRESKLSKFPIAKKLLIKLLFFNIFLNQSAWWLHLVELSTIVIM